MLGRESALVPGQAGEFRAPRFRNPLLPSVLAPLSSLAWPFSPLGLGICRRASGARGRANGLDADPVPVGSIAGEWVTGGDESQRIQGRAGVPARSGNETQLCRVSAPRRRSLRDRRRRLLREVQRRAAGGSGDKSRGQV